MDIITEENIKEAVEEVVRLYLIPDFIERGLNDTGEWINSVEVTTIKHTTSIEAKIFAPDYTEYLIRGRGPNKDQRTEAIKSWVGGMGKYVFEPWTRRNAPGLNPYAIAYKIATEGTKEYREGDHTFLDILGSQEVLDFLNQKIASFASVNISQTLRNEILKFKNL